MGQPRIAFELNHQPEIHAWLTGLMSKFKEAGYFVHLYGDWNRLPNTDILCVWNGQDQRKFPVICQIREMGMPVLFSELGWFPQMEWYYVDPIGVNYESTIPTKELLPIAEEEKVAVRGWMKQYHDKHPVVGFPHERYVFLPLQMEIDAQIRRFSRFDKMQEAIDAIAWAFKDWLIVIKAHPRVPDFKFRLPGNCIKVHVETSLHQLIRNSDAVATISSTVGAEALTYQKPVIMLGYSFYTRPDIVLPGQNMSMLLDSAVKLGSGWEPDEEKLLALMHELMRRQWSLDMLRQEKDIGRLLRGDVYAPR